MTTIEIQVKDAVFGWGEPQNVLRVNLSLERLKELRAIVRAYVLRQREANDYNPGHGTMQAQACHALMLAGMPEAEAHELVNTSTCMADTGLTNGALFGYAMFSTVRLLISRPPNTMEAAMAGEKTRWAKPLIGVAEEKALGHRPGM
jgi:hypothetical protein